MAKKRMSKETAYKLAKDYGIKFTGNADKDCSTSDYTYLAELAKVVGYRKPKGSSSSSGRNFYEHLYKKFKNSWFL
jgi:hypothetical protein